MTWRSEVERLERMMEPGNVGTLWHGMPRHSAGAGLCLEELVPRWLFMGVHGPSCWPLLLWISDQAVRYAGRGSGRAAPACTWAVGELEGRLVSGRCWHGGQALRAGKPWLSVL
jgi:hypothetical protein